VTPQLVCVCPANSSFTNNPAGGRDCACNAGFHPNPVGNNTCVPD
jgi:hypothetical protein